MNTETIKSIVNKNVRLRNKLFASGFYFTDAKVDKEDYPFYNLWNKEEIKNYKLLVHPNQHYFISEDKSLILIGHAYNPFAMESDEKIILEQLCKKTFGTDDFWNSLNELTGIFTLIHLYDGEVDLIGDPSCMQTAFYAFFDGRFFISSHTCLLGDLLDLNWDSYSECLVNYKFFPLMGNSFPGDLTQYSEVKRLVPNHYISFKDGKIHHKRFYYPYKLDISNEEIVRQVSEILKNNMLLIPEKWNRPAISMTGGCDSKTTLSCAIENYDKYSYFSYISSDSEKVDADAAHIICNALGLKHTVYKIPNDDSAFDDTEDVRAILYWNAGGIIPTNKNDVRKRIFFADIDDFDIEVKSWASEIGRSYYSKRFNERKDFGKMPTARACTTMYKFFFQNRKLVAKTDCVFEKYLNQFFELHPTNPVEWQDQFFWEFRVPSWNGLVITGEHRYSFDITIPYNNRILLNLLLSASIEDRINDTIYKQIREKMNPIIDSTGIAVTNLKHTKNREKAENIYYSIHSKIPF